jgi:hypothetical protein
MSKNETPVSLVTQHTKSKIELPNVKEPITVTARSKAWDVFTRSNTGIVGSNPTQGMDVCVYSVFVLSFVGSGLARS